MRSSGCYGVPYTYMYTSTRTARILATLRNRRVGRSAVTATTAEFHAKSAGKLRAPVGRYAGFRGRRRGARKLGQYRENWERPNHERPSLQGFRIPRG